jgi:hypothetical protein
MGDEVIRVRSMHGDILARKPDGKRPLGKPRRTWEGNIKIDLKEKGWKGVNWVHLSQDTDQWRALVNRVLNFRV